MIIAKYTVLETPSLQCKQWIFKVISWFYIMQPFLHHWREHKLAHIDKMADFQVDAGARLNPSKNGYFLLYEYGDHHFAENGAFME